MTAITLLGLGEAGRLYAEGLAEAGAVVAGYDPFVASASSAFRQFEEIADAVRDSEIVISLVGARAAAAVAAEALPHVKPGSVFADFNTASPAVKVAIEKQAAAAGVLFADVAVLAPVPRAAHRTPLMASGPGAERLHDALAPLGVPIEAIGGEAGDAASRKLLRSVFMKGLAGVVIESMSAARAAGAEQWLLEQIATELGPGGGPLVERLITGSRTHAERRSHEVRDAMEYLNELDVPNWMAAGALHWLERLLAENAAAGQGH